MFQNKNGKLSGFPLCWKKVPTSSTGTIVDAKGKTATAAHKLLWDIWSQDEIEEEVGVLRVGTHVSVLLLDKSDKDGYGVLREEHKQGLYPAVIAAVCPKYKCFIARLLGQLEEYSYSQWYFARHGDTYHSRKFTEWTYGFDMDNVPEDDELTREIYTALEGR